MFGRVRTERRRRGGVVHVPAKDARVGTIPVRKGVDARDEFKSTHVERAVILCVSTARRLIDWASDELLVGDPVRFHGYFGILFHRLTLTMSQGQRTLQIQAHAEIRPDRDVDGLPASFDFMVLARSDVFPSNALDVRRVRIHDGTSAVGTTHDVRCVLRQTYPGGHAIRSRSVRVSPRRGICHIPRDVILVNRARVANLRDRSNVSPRVVRRILRRYHGIVISKDPIFDGSLD